MRAKTLKTQNLGHNLEQVKVTPLFSTSEFRLISVKCLDSFEGAGGMAGQIVTGCGLPNKPIGQLRVGNLCARKNFNRSPAPKLLPQTSPRRVESRPNFGIQDLWSLTNYPQESACFFQSRRAKSSWLSPLWLSPFRQSGLCAVPFSVGARSHPS